jgi:hypothetical protein
MIVLATCRRGCNKREREEEMRGKKEVDQRRSSYPHQYPSKSQPIGSRHYIEGVRVDLE